MFPPARLVDVTAEVAVAAEPAVIVEAETQVGALVPPETISWPAVPTEERARAPEVEYATAPAAAATAETPKPRTAPTSTAPALHPPTPQPTPTIQKQNMTAAGMSSYSFADIDSSAMKYKPYSMISLVENG